MIIANTIADIIDHGDISNMDVKYSPLHWMMKRIFILRVLQFADDSYLPRAYEIPQTHQANRTTQANMGE